ncbi:sodium:calcium antiporter [archaeon]
MLVPIVVLVASLALLVKSADYFTEGAEKAAVALGVSPFIVGATVASIGTSIPELFTSLFSIMNGTPEAITIVMGDVIGSNIANIALVLGGTVTIMRIAQGVNAEMRFRWDLIRVDIPLLVAATAYLWLASADGLFTMGEGFVSILLYLVYFKYTLRTHRKGTKKKDGGSMRNGIIKMAIGGAGVLIGAHYCVGAIIGVAGVFAIPTTVIAASAVAIGTSLPELAVSAQAALKKKYELAIGNITGSCIFNALVVTGLPALFTPLTVSGVMMDIGLPFLLAALAMFVVVSIDKKVGHYEGYGLMALYVLFIAKLFGLF